MNSAIPSGYEASDYEASVTFAFDPNIEQHRQWVEALNLETNVEYSIDDVYAAFRNILATGDLDSRARAVVAYESYRVYLTQWLEQQLERMDLFASEHGEDAVFALEVDWEGNLYGFNVVDQPQSSS